MNESEMPNAEKRLDCRGAMDQLFDLIDGELTAEVERKVRAHITGCPRCFVHADFEERFLRAVRQARAARSAPEPLRHRVMDVLRAEGWTG
jgi:anti-sigma factor (TIGR02949 family)